jgi:hypothetical protein
MRLAVPGKHPPWGKTSVGDQFGPRARPALPRQKAARCLLCQAISRPCALVRPSTVGLIGRAEGRAPSLGLSAELLWAGPLGVLRVDRCHRWPARGRQEAHLHKERPAPSLGAAGLRAKAKCNANGPIFQTMARLGVFCRVSTACQTKNNQDHLDTAKRPPVRLATQPPLQGRPTYPQVPHRARRVANLCCVGARRPGTVQTTPLRMGRRWPGVIQHEDTCRRG